MSLIKMSEGIAHIEDLPLVDKFDKDGKLVQKNFIDRVSELAKLRITEKLDGSFLRFGVDANGKIYTTRDGKSLFYSEADWGETSLETQGMIGFKAAQTALQDQEKLITTILEPGEAIDIEILFGKQPNAITYGYEGFNHIAFLKAAAGTNSEIKPDQSNVEALVKKMKSAVSNVKINILDTDDGIHIKKVPTSTKWKFISAQLIDGKKLEDVDIKAELKALKDFLSSKNEATAKLNLDLTNLEVATINLTSVDKEKRDAIANERQALNGKILNDFKLSIKAKLLKNFVKHVKSGLGDQAEGVVLLDPDTDEQVKIVNKDVFTAINTFNQSIRRELKGAVRSSDPNAALDSRGGLLGDVKIRIANLFNIPELARSTSAKKVFAEYRGATAEETISKFATSLKNLNEEAYRTKISAILKNAISELDTKLKEFKENYQTYKLTLKNGDVIGYSPETVKRSLLAFAETHVTINNLKQKVDSSTTFDDLINALFGKLIKMIHDNDSTKVNEDKNLASVDDNYAQTGDSRTRVVKVMAGEQIVDAYLATYIGAIVLLRNGDKQAAKILRDPSNCKLKKYSPSMNSLNFWGLFAMEPRNCAALLNKDAYHKLEHYSQRILSSRVKQIHYPINSSTNLSVHWDEVDENLRILMLRLERQTPTNRIIRTSLLKWNYLTANDKAECMSAAFYYLLRVDPGSDLLGRLRQAINDARIMAPRSKLLRDLTKINEDGEGGDAGTADSGSTAADAAMATVGTTSSDIANFPYRLFKGKVVRRLPRKMGKKSKISKEKSGYVRLS